MGAIMRNCSVADYVCFLLIEHCGLLILKLPCPSYSPGQFMSVGFFLGLHFCSLSLAGFARFCRRKCWIQIKNKNKNKNKKDPRRIPILRQGGRPSLSACPTCLARVSISFCRLRPSSTLPRGCSPPFILLLGFQHLEHPCCGPKRHQKSTAVHSSRLFVFPPPFLHFLHLLVCSSVTGSLRHDTCNTLPTGTHFCVGQTRGSACRAEQPPSLLSPSITSFAKQKAKRRGKGLSKHPVTLAEGNIYIKKKRHRDRDRTWHKNHNGNCAEENGRSGHAWQ
jgi:hypothetical protein